MQKRNLCHLDLDLYTETLENGLEIYVLPKTNVNNIYVTLSTKFGSAYSEFLPIGEKKMIKVTEGIAHFLEHKCFEQKDGIDPFTFFNERGTDANANTSNYKTTYLFSGPAHLEENLNFLFDYVQDPYFTDENVEKEKGIITQEIEMYQDDPFWRIYEGSVMNAFIKHPIRYPVAGSVESIRKITKEELYQCYNTFYHPSNMFLVVSGNVNPEEVIRIAKENQEKKNFDKKFSIQTKTYKEPDQVAKDLEVISMNIRIPKASIGYKINISKIKKLSTYEIITYLLLYLDIKIGATSLLTDRLKKEGAITQDLEYSMIRTTDHVLFMIFLEAEDPNKVIEEIKKELSNPMFDEDDFKRKQKANLSAFIYMSDEIVPMNNKVMNDVVQYDKVILDNYNIVKKMQANTLKDLLTQVHFDTFTTFMINPKENKN